MSKEEQLKTELLKKDKEQIIELYLQKCYDTDVEIEQHYDVLFNEYVKTKIEAKELDIEIDILRKDNEKLKQDNERLFNRINDLKELEKFGYRSIDNGYQKDYVGEASKKDIDLYYNTYKSVELDNYFCAGISIFIDIEQKEVDVTIEIYGYHDIQTVFLSCDKEYYIKDLIQAGFVEKVVREYDTNL